jgi:hypothetical protein
MNSKITINVFDRSSVIDRASYDASAKVLGIVFKSGKCYRYGDVPASVASGLGQALSAGEFFNRQIKPVFPCKRDKGAEEFANS